ncbi:MAG: hypothetical protein QOF24_1536 [Verrucomicrobiota bacterium]|jgi:hypothetical protein
MHLSLPPNPTGTPYIDGSASLNASAEDALNIWNQYLGHMRFVVDRNSVLPASGTDGDTSVLAASTFYGQSFGSRTLAVTLITPNFTNPEILDEADVIINSAIPFNSYPGPLRSDAQDFHRIALHEFGHVLGLDHPDEAGQSKLAIMNSTVSNIYTLQSDDILGAQSIYANGPDYQPSFPAPNLVNLSTRALVGTGERVLIGGFIVQGSQPATVVLRALGNSLRALGLGNTLHDPLMVLRDSNNNIIQTSDDWISNANPSATANYHLDPPNSRESAILATLNPGSYTFVVQAFDNGYGDLTGTTVIELYDLHTTGGRAGNISSRGQVLNGNDILIGGFIVGGSQAKEVVVRALGPSLAASNVANPLSDPTLELRDASGNLVDFNDNWGNHPKAALIQAEHFDPTKPAESALQDTLLPGNYTAIVRGAGSATGIGLVEIYDLSPPPN